MTDELNQPNFALPQTFYIFYDEIDAQHEGLVEIINACLANLVDGVLEDFEEPFEEFITHLAAHFRHEESLMRDLGFKGLDWHASHHKDCLERVNKLIANMRAQGYAGLRELRMCFHDIIYDIAHADLKFGEFLDGQGLSRRTEQTRQRAVRL